MKRLARRYRTEITLVVVAVLISVLTPADPAEAVVDGQFVVRCRYSHTLRDDPIVFPGAPGASHSHDFFGNTSADAFSTIDSLLAAETTCRAASDTAGYWAPTAYLNGQPIKPTVMRIYYLGDRGQQIETIPAGLKVIGGNPHALTAGENPHVRWYCGEVKGLKTPRRDAPYDCSPWRQFGFVDGLIAIVDLPSCWDGVGLEPENVAYPSPACPSSHPHAIPRLSERIHYGVMNPMNPDGTVALTLSSGEYWTMHADLWNTWQQDRLDDLVDNCILAKVRCGSIDALASLDWTDRFGTVGHDVAAAAAAGRAGAYVAGTTDGELPGQTQRRGQDAFVRAYDRAGRVRWTRQFGTSGVDRATALAAAGDRIVVAGSTTGRLPGQQAKGGTDGFVAAFGADGKLRWQVQIGTRANDEITAVATSGASGLYVAGWTEGRIGRGRGGRRDGWVARLSGTGQTLWVRQLGGAGTDEVRALGIRGTDVLAAGWTDASIGGGGTSLGGADAFVRAYSPDGRVMWTRQFGTPGDDVATAVAGYGREVFVAGSTSGVLPRQQAHGGLDAFVRSLDADGTIRWTDQFGTETDDEAAGIAVRKTGLYVVGSTAGVIGRDDPLGGTDVFARRYLRRGPTVWTLQLGAAGADNAYGMAATKDALFLAGAMSDASDDPAASPQWDAFLMKLAFT